MTAARRYREAEALAEAYEDALGVLGARAARLGRAAGRERAQASRVRGGLAARAESRDERAEVAARRRERARARDEARRGARARADEYRRERERRTRGRDEHERGLAVAEMEVAG